MSRTRVPILLALLCVVAYLPALRQPFIEDDYPHLAIAQHLGDPANWRELAAHPFRFRATAEWFLFAGYRAFATNPAPYYAMTIALHILCTLLVYAMGTWPLLGFELSAWAAAFFAIYEGHQEAVMWISACNELWQFLFIAAAFVAWLQVLYGKRNGPLWLAAALLSFTLALLSKESVPAFAILFAIPLYGGRPRPRGTRSRLGLTLFAALAALGLAALYAARSTSFRFSDGSFSLHAPFWLTLPNSFVRLFWFWGLLALYWAWKQNRRAVAVGLIWAAIALVPYGFLTYSTRVPSRQTYLASVGIAWIVGAALQHVTRFHSRVLPIVCAALLLHNVGYLWTKKRRQYLERAEPTQQLIALARRTSGPIYVQCFPRPRPIAEEAVHLLVGNPVSDVIWDAEDAKRRHAEATFCYAGK